MRHKESILLVNPNFDDNPLKTGQSHIFFPNLGIDSIYTYLTERYSDLNICVLDGVLHNLSNEQIKEEILRHSADVVGFSTTYATLEDVLQMSREIKVENPATITVLGGIGAKSLKALTKGKGVEGLDYCIAGDGERLLEKVINSGRVHEKTEYLQDIILDFDSLPFPLREAFDTEQYIQISQRVNKLNPEERYLQIVTSKGCAWGKCVFCSVDKKHRARTLNKAEEELRYLIERFRITKVYVFDDDFFSDLRFERAFGLCNVFEKFGLRWSFDGRPSDIAVNVELSKILLKRMKQSGCTEIGWGAESLDTKILEKLRKGISLEDIKKAISLATEAGIGSRILLIYNSPWETKESLDNTLNAASDLISDNNIKFLKLSKYANFPGSIGWHLGLPKNNVSEKDLAAFEDKLISICQRNDINLGLYKWE